jgi:hypothetical protein
LLGFFLKKCKRTLLNRKQQQNCVHWCHLTCHLWFHPSKDLFDNLSWWEIRVTMIWKERGE